MDNLKKIYKFSRGIVGKAGAYFMFIFIFFSVFAKAILKLDGFSYDSAFFGGTVLFSFVMAFIDLTLDFKTISSFTARVAIHYVLATADFALVLCYISGAARGGRQILAMTIFFTVVYAVIMTIVCIFRAVCNKRENKEKSYRAQFTGKDQ